jgi:hypothetical protein
VTAVIAMASHSEQQQLDNEVQARLMAEQEQAARALLARTNAHAPADAASNTAPQDPAAIKERLLRMTEQARQEGAGGGGGNGGNSTAERGGGSWANYQPPSQVLAAVAAQQQSARPPPPPPPSLQGLPRPPRPPPRPPGA